MVYSFIKSSHPYSLTVYASIRDLTDPYPIIILEKKMGFSLKILFHPRVELDGY
jgi:hypothetical protein